MTEKLDMTVRRTFKLTAEEVQQAVVEYIDEHGPGGHVVSAEWEWMDKDGNHITGARAVVTYTIRDSE